MSKILIRKKVKEINEENFFPYGQLIDTPKTKSDLKLGFLPGRGYWKIGGETEIAACSQKETTKPIEKMERHLHTPEVFIVVEGGMVVGLSKEESELSRQTSPVAEAVELFNLREGQGIIMQPGLWHIVFVPKGEGRSCFFIIFARDTAKKDWFMQPFTDGKQILPF